VEWLAERSDVTNLVVDDNLVMLTHDGGPEQQALLLKEIVEAGIAIVEYASKTKSLEDVFLHVTEGRVQ